MARYGRFSRSCHFFCEHGVTIRSVLTIDLTPHQRALVSAFSHASTATLAWLITPCGKRPLEQLINHVERSPSIAAHLRPRACGKVNEPCVRFVFHAPISPNRPKGLGRIKFAITAHSSALFPSPMHALWAASSLKVRVDNFFCEMQPAAAARDPQRLSAALFQLSLERNSHRRLPQDRGITVRVKPLCAVIFVCFLLLPAAPIHAEWPSIQPPQAPSSGIAQKFLNGLRNPGAHHHRTESSPPLPRPRPPELPRESVELNKAAPEVAPASEFEQAPGGTHIR